MKKNAQMIIVATAILLSTGGMVAVKQRVPLITLDELERRLENGGDTTFVVNLWATWCAPCVAEMPHFERLQAKFRSKPLHVLFVSVDARKDLEAVNRFVEARKLKSEVLLLDEQNEQEFIPKVSPDWSGAIPATLFVNNSMDFRVFKEQEFDYQELERTYLSIITQ
jgi:Thiol-disulfide isomerase and thioredoxins